jgi:hypothetical protein
MIENQHVPRNGRTVQQAPRLSMQGMSDFQVHPNGRRSGEDDVISFARFGDGPFEIGWQVRQARRFSEVTSQIYYPFGMLAHFDELTEKS